MMEELTERERQVLHLLEEEGLAISQAAKRLGVNRNTVASDVLKIERKLGRPVRLAYGKIRPKTLTPRQREVLELYEKIGTLYGVAKAMGIKEPTARKIFERARRVLSDEHQTVGKAE